MISTRRRKVLAALAVAVVAAIVAVGIATTSGGGDPMEPLSAQQVRDRIASAEPKDSPMPAKLAALQSQAGRIVPGAQSALDRRLADLRGTPIVLNVWGAWCGPCREEMPLLQRAAAKYAKRVAFLGLDTQDPADRARAFLEQVPVPYPSIQDLRGAVADGLGLSATPSTIFYDRDGNTVIKQGVYRSLDDLEHDIETFAAGA